MPFTGSHPAAIIPLLRTGLAPASLRDRLAPELPARPRHHVRSVAAVVLVLVSLVIGAATHVLWDAFTHVDRWGTEHIAWLAATHGPLTGYHWMQYASGVLGAGVLAVTVVRWWRSTPRCQGAQRVPALGRREALTCGGVIAACLVLGAVAGLAYGFDDGLLTAGFLALTWGTGAAVGAALVCAAVCAPRLRAEIAPSAR
jgi:hypothetical protein